MTAEIKERFKKARRLFPHTKNVVYFNSASYGPFSTEVKRVIDENVQLRMAGEQDDTHHTFRIADELRADYARLIGAAKRQIGLGLNTSLGLNLAAFGLPLKKGDEVLMPDIEFPAVPYVWRAAAEARGLKVRFMRSRDGRFHVDELKKAVSRKSRVLSLSWVQFFNGYKNDLAELSALCKSHGMYLVVDGIQGMGVEPINVRKLGVDIFASGCQKWMLSPQGCGFFYLSDEVRDRITPPFMSWLGVDWKMNFSDLFHFDRPWFDSARRFELGYYVVLNLLSMKASVEMFKTLGVRNIRRHNYALIDRLADYIRSRPSYRITSSMETKHRSSIFTFTCKDVERLHKAILKEKIILSRREGSIRVSVHLFNNEADIDKLIAVLESFAGC
jgi:selenocysteine lyase/cysteine desulfurase